MAAAIWAGVAYAVIVFLIGFVFGTIRVLLLIPHLGKIVAVSLEAPIMLVASWFVCRGCLGRFDVPRRVGVRSAMSVVAFIVLMLAELGLSVLVFGRSTVQSAALYDSLPGAMGLAAQIIFAMFPVVQIWKSGD